MLENETIVCISPSSWFSLWRNRQQIMSRLSQNNRVVFIEPQRNLLSFFKNFPKEYKLLFSIQSVKMNNNLDVFYSPPSLPLLGHLLPKILLKALAPMITKINNMIFRKYINKLLHHLRIKNPVIFYYNPFHYKLSGAFDEKLIIYYVYDELTLYPQNICIKDIIEKYDTQFSKKADIVFASSYSQYARRHCLNENTYVINNAVDFNNFNKTMCEILSIPDDIGNIPHPIIGYTGFLGFQIDVNLLLEIAKTHPKWSLVLIGPDNLPRNKIYYELKGMNNVHFLGEKDAKLLPNYIKSFDIAIMPYDITTHVKTSFPLKCFEYLATGTPIVSVNLPMLADLKEIVKLANTPKEFLSHIENLLKIKPNEIIKKGIEEARKNTWDKRIAELSEHISTVLQEKY